MVQQQLIDDELALELQEAGLVWHPEPGDHFRIKAEAMAEDVFILSHMVIEAREVTGGSVLRFNGTTEWALDSVPQDDALWLPREDQLRERLGDAFVRLERTGPEGPGFLLTTRGLDGAEREFTAASPSDAYGHALLEWVRLAVAEV